MTALILVPASASADYVGSEEVLSLTWGKGERQIDMQTHSGIGPGWKWLPKEENLFNVLEDGTVVLIDRGNAGLKYFKNGMLQKKEHLDKTLIEKYQKQQMDICKEVKWETQNSYTGRTTVACGDKTVMITDRFTDYVRDASGNLYGIHRGWHQVKKYDGAGKELGGLRIEEEREYPGPKQAYLGGPVLAPNGDAYFWKSTSEKFSIIRYVWRDVQVLYGRPDAPRYVEAQPTQDGIAIHWWFPFQNREAITGFEVVRAEKSGTPPYVLLGAIQKSPAFFEDKTALKSVTYYYRVRTISGDKYSVYSNEAICRR